MGRRLWTYKFPIEAGSGPESFERREPSQSCQVPNATLGRRRVISPYVLVLLHGMQQGRALAGMPLARANTLLQCAQV